MTIYEAKTPEELREAVVALSIDVLKPVAEWTTASLRAHAERIVPPVPTPEPEYNAHKGVTYREGLYHLSGCVYRFAASVIDRWSEEFTDDDHAALLALKANPVKTARKKLDPDEVLAKMYAKQEAIETATAQYDAAASAPVPDMVFNATPATVASEPECIAALRWMVRAGDKNLYDSGERLVTQAAKLLHAYDNKPATEAEALAVLVGVGYSDEVRYECPEYFAGGTLFATKCEHKQARDRRVLIAPEGKV